MEVLNFNPSTVIAIISAALGSSVLTTIVNNLLSNRTTKRERRRELLAKAQSSVLKRVELCYRIRRRANDDDDAIKIRDMVHDVQEENEYYRCLLLSESKWYGNRYSLYLEAIRRLTGESMKKAWQKEANPGITMEEDIRLDHKQICKLSEQFSLDSRRFMCFPRKLWMSIHDTFRKVKKYNIEEQDG